MNQIIIDALIHLTDKAHKMGFTIIPKSNLKRQSLEKVE